MMRKCALLTIVSTLLLAACDSEPDGPAAAETGGAGAAQSVGSKSSPSPVPDPEALSKLQGLSTTGDWKVVLVNRKDFRFDVTMFDKSTIVIQPNGARLVWEAAIHADKGATYYTLSHVAYDCSQRTMKTVESITRNETGSSSSRPGGEPSSAVPGTQGNLLLDTACDNALLAKATAVPQGIDPVVFVRRLSLGVRTTSNDLAEADFRQLLELMKSGQPFRLEAAEAAGIMSGFKLATSAGKAGYIDTDADRKQVSRLIRANVSTTEVRKALIAYIS